MDHDAKTTGDLVDGMRTDQLDSDELSSAHDQLHYMFRADSGDKQLAQLRLPQIVRNHARIVVALGKRGMSHPPPPDDGLDATVATAAVTKDLPPAPSVLEAAAKEPVNIVVPIAKVDAEQRIATGVVLEPDSVDAQNDTISADEIASAAYKFLANHQSTTRLGIQHVVFGQIGIELYESWIAKTDFALGTQQVPKGSWLMSIHASSDDVWRRIKSGEITGFSIGGEASRSH